LQALLATYWADNAVSATLSFKQAKQKPVFLADGTKLLNKFGDPKLEIDQSEEDGVIDSITNVLDQYKGTIKSTSLLPHATGIYPQMPYEEITKEEYEAKVSKLKAKPWELITGEIQGEETFDDVVGECQGAGCPVK